MSSDWAGDPQDAHHPGHNLVCRNADLAIIRGYVTQQADPDRYKEHRTVDAVTAVAEALGVPAGDLFDVVHAARAKRREAEHFAAAMRGLFDEEFGG